LLRFVTHIHAFHIDLLARLLPYAVSCTGCDLIITVDTKFKASLAHLLLKEFALKAEVIVVGNYGRDLGALFQIWHTRIHPFYSHVIHLHTKRSVHLDSSISLAWLDYMLSSINAAALLNSRQCIELLTDGRVGMVIPTPNSLFLMTSWGQCFQGCRDLMKRMNIRLQSSRGVNYPAGSFFVLDVCSAHPLFDSITISDFPAEPLANSGEFPHILERSLSIFIAHSKDILLSKPVEWSVGYRAVNEHILEFTRISDVLIT